MFGSYFHFFFFWLHFFLLHTLFIVIPVRGMSTEKTDGETKQIAIIVYTSFAVSFSFTTFEMPCNLITLMIEAMNKPKGL